MIPIEAGSSYAPIGEAPKESSNFVVVIISLSLLALTVYAVQRKLEHNSHDVN